MTSIFAILFFTLTQLTVEQQLAEKYCPSKINFKKPCPSCGSLQTIKNGSTHNGKSKCQCNECGRQFVINPSQKTVSEETKQLIDRLLLLVPNKFVFIEKERTATIKRRSN